MKGQFLIEKKNIFKVQGFDAAKVCFYKNELAKIV